jgi:cytoplasmic iron level regulating protein YaaA (DUF328/UPF0246 family)
MSYLIACSSCKNNPNNFENFQSSIHELSFPELNEYRLVLINNFANNLDWNHTLPAWKLYSGPLAKLYPRIHEENWMKPCVDIKIMSALFGWVKHTDLLPHYDVTMENRLGDIKIWRFWLNTGVMNDFVDENDIDLLSSNYRRAIDPIGIVPDVNFGPGINSLHKKGVWLNNQLTNLFCD